MTVFAGGPPPGAAPTRWDAAAGFVAGDDVAARRRAEDRAALARLGARPVWLDFWDSQYGRTPPVAEVAAALDAAIAAEAPDAVAIPLGLWHSDHRLAHEAGAGLARRRPGLRWLAYADAIYRRFPDAGIAERFAALAAAGLAARPAAAPGTPAGEAKRAALACYHSQLRALAAPGYPGFADALAPEAYWRLVVAG